MNRLENFLGKEDEPKPNLKYFGKRYQCQICNEYTDDSHIDENNHVIYWYCVDGHESKVSFV